MKRRNQARIRVASVLTLLAILLVAGCESDTTAKIQLDTSVSVDNSTHRATIEFHTNRDTAIVALFVDYPDGHRRLLSSGNVGSAGGSIQMEELVPGDYTYTVYWIPQGSQDPDSVPEDEIVEKGLPATGKFTIP
jgi:hypothetical protein